MAKNLVYDQACLSVACDHPAAPKSGDPVRVGSFCGVALTDEGADGKTTVDFREKVWDLPAISLTQPDIKPGDPIYYKDSVNPPLVNSPIESQAFFGYALEALPGNDPAIIKVLKVYGGIPGAVPVGSISSSEIANGAVTESKLGSGAVTESKLGSGAVTKTKLAGGFLKAAIIEGGAAGGHTVTGIASGDELVLVARFDIETATVVGVGDLTSECSISAADTISNTGGTDTTGDKLLVLYLDLT